MIASQLHCYWFSRLPNTLVCRPSSNSFWIKFYFVSQVFNADLLAFRFRSLVAFFYKLIF